MHAPGAAPLPRTPRLSPPPPHVLTIKRVPCCQPPLKLIDQAAASCPPPHELPPSAPRPAARAR